MTSPVIAMEISQRDGGVAVRCPDGSVLVERLTSSTRRGDALMPAVESICRQAGITPGDLEGIGVSIGPGGFTGLRIGIAAAKMLSWSLDIPLVAMQTALLAAETAEDLDGLMAVVLASKDDTCWLTLVEGSSGSRSISQAGTLVDPEMFLATIPRVDHLLVDEHLPESMAGHGLTPRRPEFDPAVLLEMTERRLASGETLDPLELSPLYPREPEAVRLWDSRTGN
tara:strand:+ start:17042 stop:17719 length:678 start_codon:yes stop_codon:yes gene_type:complete